MSRPWRAANRKPAPLVASRAEWRGLATLARSCASQALAGEVPADAGPLLTLGARASRADFGVLDREAGFATGETARALTRLTSAFAGVNTSAATRAAIAPALTAVAELLDDQLHALNAAEFQRAHEGRPEVWG